MNLFKGAVQFTDHFTMIINGNNILFGLQIDHSDELKFENKVYPGCFTLSIWLWCFCFIFCSNSKMRFGTLGDDVFEGEKE